MKQRDRFPSLYFSVQRVFELELHVPPPSTALILKMARSVGSEVKFAVRLFESGARNVPADMFSCDLSAMIPWRYSGVPGTFVCLRIDTAILKSEVKFEPGKAGAREEHTAHRTKYMDTF